MFKSKSRHCPSEYDLFWLNRNKIFWDPSSVIYNNAKLSVRTDECFEQFISLSICAIYSHVYFTIKIAQLKCV